MPISTKRRAPAKLAAPIVKANAVRPTKNTIDESRATISGTDALRSEAIEISSDSDSDDGFSGEDNDDDEDEAQQDEPDEVPAAKVNGKLISPKENDEADEAGSDGEATSPSFGELLRGNEAIDVAAMLQQSSAANGAVVPATRSRLAPPQHQSLTTVLSQALRTDDVELLESCLQTTDINTIKNTIEHIDSSLAGTLLTKLAARMYRRPGRAGSLMTWVQWTLVAHGGALASQPKALHQLNGLQKVLADRAKGLNSLLALKGKLDMLEGQMDLRRRMQRGPDRIQHADDDDEDDEDVIWVEGEDKDVAKDLANGISSRRKRGDADDDDDDDDEEDIAALVANGFVADSDDEEEFSGGEDDDSDGVEEQLDEDEVDHDDVDESMGEEEESDVEAAPPSKKRK